MLTDTPFDSHMPWSDVHQNHRWVVVVQLMFKIRCTVLSTLDSILKKRRTFTMRSSSTGKIFVALTSAVTAPESRPILKLNRILDPMNVGVRSLEGCTGLGKAILV